MRGALLVVGVCGSAGCSALLGVHDFGPTAGDAPRDDGAAADAPDERCLARWLDGTVTFSAPVPFAAAIAATGTSVDRDPALSLDGRTLYWSTDRNGKSFDVWSAALDDTGAPSLAAVAVRYDTDALDETKLTFAAGGLDTILSSGRTNAGTPAQLAESVRQAPSDAELFSQQPFAGGIDNEVDNVFDPSFAAAGSALYYASAPQGRGSEILRAARKGDGTWGAGVAVFAGHTDTTLDADPAPTDDERLLVFSSNRPGAVGPSGLFYAVRSSASDAFGDIRHLDALDGARRDGDPVLSADACTVMFSSDRDTSDLVFRLYLARVTP